MKILCRPFRQVEEAEEKIRELETEVKKEGLSVKDIKIIDRISLGGVITAGMLIILAE